jgi:hypothetical protein
MLQCNQASLRFLKEIERECLRKQVVIAFKKMFAEISII